MTLIRLALAVSIILLSTVAQGKIYKWVDENGTVHFSDKPLTAEAEAVKIKPVGIQMDNPPPGEKANSNQGGATPEKQATSNKRADKLKQKSPADDNLINEDDYRISTSVGEIGADIIRISGRISSGPRCDSLTIKATARSDTGLTASITDKVKKTNSFGSVTFEGMAKVSGSDDDFGFWEVTDVTVRCNDK